MTRRRRILFLASLFLFLCCAALNAHAAEEGGAATERVTEIFKWINFAIVACLILWVFGKVLPPKFRSNAEKISSPISNATAAKAEADRQLREAETKLATLHKEVPELRAFAEPEGAGEADPIHALPTTASHKILLSPNA